MNIQRKNNKNFINKLNELLPIFFKFRAYKCLMCKTRYTVIHTITRVTCWVIFWYQFAFYIRFHIKFESIFNFNSSYPRWVLALRHNFCKESRRLHQEWRF
jgi:hypothetical protein